MLERDFDLQLFTETDHRRSMITTAVIDGPNGSGKSKLSDVLAALYSTLNHLSTPESIKYYGDNANGVTATKVVRYSEPPTIPKFSWGDSPIWTDFRSLAFNPETVADPVVQLAVFLEGRRMVLEEIKRQLRFVDTDITAFIDRGTPSTMGYQYYMIRDSNPLLAEFILQQIKDAYIKGYLVKSNLTAIIIPDTVVKRINDNDPYTSSADREIVAYKQMVAEHALDFSTHCVVWQDVDPTGKKNTVTRQAVILAAILQLQRYERNIQHSKEYKIYCPMWNALNRIDQALDIFWSSQMGRKDFTALASGEPVVCGNVIFRGYPPTECSIEITNDLP